jgi:hypothetical protein
VASTAHRLAAELTASDRGAGFAADNTPFLPSIAAESGRELYVMAALSGYFRILSRPGRGTRPTVGSARAS